MPFIIIIFIVIFSLFNIFNNADNYSSPIQRQIQTSIANAISSHSYEENMKLGNIEYNKKNYKKASHYYTYAIKQRQNSSEAYYKRGYSKYMLDKDYEAKQDFKKAYDLNPKNIKALYKYAVTSIPNYAYYNNDLEIENIEYFEHLKSELNKQCQQAINALDTVIKYQPKNVEAYIYRGIAKKQMGHFNNALNDFHYALGLSPKNSEVYLELGKLFYDLVDYKEYAPPKVVYINVRDSLNTDCDSQEDKDLARIYRKEYLQAIAYYNKAVSLNPNDYNIYFNRGYAKWSLNNYSGAIKDFQKAYSISHDKDIYFNIMHVKIDMAEYYKHKNNAVFQKLCQELNHNYAFTYEKFKNDKSVSEELQELKKRIDNLPYDDIFPKKL